MANSVAYRAPIDLNLLGPFLLVCDTGSFAKAAEKLALRRSSVSRAVAALEQAVGARLFNRTTRRVTPTTAGTALYAKVAPLYAGLNASLHSLPEAAAAPSGLLRMTATHDVGIEFLAKALAGFGARYPAVQLDVQLGHRPVDMVAEGFDVALRVALGGKLRDSSLRAKRLTHFEVQLFASPLYVARQPFSSAEGLQGHTLLAVPEMLTRVGEPLASYHDKVRLMADDTLFIRNAAKASLGVALLPTFLAQADVEAGLLVRVLPRLTMMSGELFFAHPYGAHAPPKVLAMREYLVDYLAAHPLVA